MPPRTRPARPAAPKLGHRAFATPQQLEQWLKAHHATERELWVRIFKKASKIASVSWDDCVVAALAWGWIDGLKKPLDEDSYLQRLTPRRARSNWSQRNREHAERLIAEGRMQPAGLAHVEAARQDGRWDNAYAGSADMVIPDDFLAALRRVPAAKRFFATLDRRNLFVIYVRLHSAKRPATRQRRLEALLAQLAAGKTPLER
ncbi:MAG: YdeI/OmpD-associated family protein [Kofleriaceae bacterium]